MPKAFSEQEKTYIRKRLKEEAALCLEKYGIRKTTVDELVKRVNIPKGTFYLFYTSKELLFFDVFLDFHETMHAELLKVIEDFGEKPTPDQIAELIFCLYKEAENSIFYRFAFNGELEWLLRKLPPEVSKAHAEIDDLSIERFLSLIPGVQNIKVPAFSAALRGIFLSMLHKREIGEKDFDEALKIMIRGIILQMFGEKTQ
jgi:AcrR family transcriptional regulator